MSSAQARALNQTRLALAIAREWRALMARRERAALERKRLKSERERLEKDRLWVRQKQEERSGRASVIGSELSQAQSAAESAAASGDDEEVGPSAARPASAAFRATEAEAEREAAVAEREEEEDAIDPDEHRDGVWIGDDSLSSSSLSSSTASPNTSPVPGTRSLLPGAAIGLGPAPGLEDSGRWRQAQARAQQRRAERAQLLHRWHAHPQEAALRFGRTPPRPKLTPALSIESLLQRARERAASQQRAAAAASAANAASTPSTPSKGRSMRATILAYLRSDGTSAGTVCVLPRCHVMSHWSLHVIRHDYGRHSSERSGGSSTPFDCAGLRWRLVLRPTCVGSAPAAHSSAAATKCWVESGCTLCRDPSRARAVRDARP
jgi:hypothetical protein